MPITRGNARTFDHDVVINGYRLPAGVSFKIPLKSYVYFIYIKVFIKYLPSMSLFNFTYYLHNSSVCNIFEAFGTRLDYLLFLAQLSYNYQTAGYAKIY